MNTKDSECCGGCKTATNKNEWEKRVAKDWNKQAEDLMDR